MDEVEENKFYFTISLNGKINIRFHFDIIILTIINHFGQLFVRILHHYFYIIIIIHFNVKKKDS